MLLMHGMHQKMSSRKLLRICTCAQNSARPEQGSKLPSLQTLRSGWMSVEISWGLQIRQDSQRDAVRVLCGSLMVSSLTQQVRGQIWGFSSVQDSGPRKSLSHLSRRLQVQQGKDGFLKEIVLMCRQECTSHRARQTVRQKRIWLWQKKVSFINDGYIIYIKLVALKKKRSDTRSKSSNQEFFPSQLVLWGWA